MASSGKVKNEKSCGISGPFGGTFSASPPLGYRDDVALCLVSRLSHQESKEYTGYHVVSICFYKDLA